MRMVPRLGMAALVAVLIAVTGASTASAETRFHVDYTRIGIYPRAAASMDSPKVGDALSDGAPVSVACEAEGTAVSNGYQTSIVWDQLTDGTWIPNAFLATGYDGWTPGVPRCEQPPTASSSSLPATATCYGDYCSGQDPETTGCSADAETVAVVVDDKGGGRLELRWSPTCKTNWARWQQYPVGWCMNCTPIGLYAVQEGGYTQSVDFTKNTPREMNWTPMIYSPQKRLRRGCRGHAVTPRCSRPPWIVPSAGRRRLKPDRE